MKQPRLPDIDEDTKGSSHASCNSKVKTAADVMRTILAGDNPIKIVKKALAASTKKPPN